MIGQLPETFKKNERFLRLWLKPLWAENTAALDGGGVLFSYFRLLSLLRRVGAGCVTLTGSEAGKLSSRPCSSDCSSLRLRRPPARACACRRASPPRGFASE